MSESAEDHWFALHEQLTARVRRGVLLLLTLVAVTAVDGLGHIQHQKERYAFAREFVRSIEGTEHDGARTVYRKVTDPSGEFPSAVRVRLEEIPEVRFKYRAFLQEVHPDRTLSLWSWELQRSGYTYAVLYGPIALLVLMYLRLRSMRRIASSLRAEAIPDGRIQQRLNSVFSDRVTRSLGENRLSYSLLWGALLFLLSAVPHVLLLVWQAAFTTNTLVSVSSGGLIQALPEVTRPERVIIRKMSLETAGEVMLYMVLTAVVVTFVTRVVFDQLRPTGRSNEKGAA